ncbi:MAG: hypothetical protein HS104_09635 [Polyangiaceae bacterium]|nr:hypothetical protein [Polyangiaceae bacterium]MCE7890755.1 hypothetical protein [Sorangiineae bacterium PRO1]MCL4754348.1 hypothetical protein [Myxococcales bacterium]
MNHAHPKAGALLLSEPIRMAQSPRPMTDADRANAEAFARFRAAGGGTLYRDGEPVLHAKITETPTPRPRPSIPAGGHQPPKEDPMKQIALAVRAHGGQNLSAKCYSYLATTHRDAFALMSETERHFQAGELANQIRMAEGDAPPAPPAPAPSGASGGSKIGALTAFLTKEFKAALSAAIAENQAAALALLDQLVADASPAAAIDLDGGVTATLPNHLAAIPGPNATEKARLYLCAKVPGFSSRNRMEQNWEAGQYLGRGAPVL